VLGRRGPTSLRLGMGSFATAVLLGFAAIVLGIASGLLTLNWGYSLSARFAQLGELSWLSIPLFFGSQLSLRSHFGDVFYGLTHLTVFLERAPVVYAPMLAVGMGVICLGLLSPVAADRQIGAGLLLLAAGGFAPRAPGLLLYLCLGALLMTRGCLARATLEATKDILRTRD